MKDKNQDFTDPPLGKQNIGDQPPKTVFIFNFFIFNGIYLFMLIYSMYMKILPTSVILPFLLSVPGIVTAILNIVIPVLIYKKYIPEIQYFTKNENGIHQANRALKKYSAISIAVPIVLTIIGTVVSILWLKIDEPAKIFSCVFSSLGSLCIFGLLFYVLYIQKLENWASFLPLKTEYVTMSYITRGMLVAFFLFFAVFFLTSAPIIAMIYNGTDIIYTFMHSVLPAAGIVMVLSIFINFRLYNNLNNHIEDIMQLTEELSAGNFAGTPLLVKSRDMFGVLVNHLNNFQKHTGNLLTSVVHNTQLMSGVGKELSSNMIETASVVQKISTSIGGVKQQVMTQAASVTETAATVEEIIRTIKQLNASIENQVTSVAQSSSAVEQMVTNITSITHTLNTTNDVIKTLATATTDGKETIRSSTEVTQKIAEESGSLLEASNVIQHIASQTNLLAMNAAIEAAHAGEAGKGFAVVADEIRKLAEESSAQGKTITATLKTLSGEIETLSESSKTAGDTFNSIFALSEQVKDMSSRLMSAMREQENGSREVLEAIRTINTVTTEVQIGSGEMLRGGEGVAGEMQKLDGLTRIITDSMNEMAFGIVQISNAVLGVNEITQKNTESIENLAKEVKKFKV